MQMILIKQWRMLLTKILISHNLWGFLSWNLTGKFDFFFLYTSTSYQRIENKKLHTLKNWYFSPLHTQTIGEPFKPLNSLSSYFLARSYHQATERRGEEVKAQVNHCLMLILYVEKKSSKGCDWSRSSITSIGHASWQGLFKVLDRVLPSDHLH